MFHFFGGKGGVGKTTCAAAYAVRACDEGARVLIVSTDPAHSLGDALGMRVGARPKAVRVGKRAIHALELDADRALARWMRSRADVFRTIAERGTYLDDQDVDRMMQLSLPGVDELIGLLELRRVASAGNWDLVVVDTAPTGHTLRLLQTPEALARVARVFDEMQAKHRLLAESIAGRYLPDEADDAVLEISEEASALYAMLRDRLQCRATWVLLPEAMSIAETEDALRTLEAMGMEVAELLVNRVTPRPERPCVQCTPRTKGEAMAIATARARFRGRAVVTMPAASAEPRGVAALRALGESPATPRRPKAAGDAGESSRRSPIGAAAFLSEGAPAGRTHLLFFGGKGGVGKTTCATAAAVALARASRRVLLLSTDPAHSLSDALGVTIGDRERPVPRVRGLYAREIDARAAFETERQRYHDAIDEVFRAMMPSSRMDASYDRIVMEDLIDLAPSGIDEVFAIVTLVDALEPRTSRKGWDTIVVDTAPTGHTLRLLAMPGIAREWAHALLGILLKYRRILGLGELASDVLAFARKLRALEELLRDESCTSFVAVTRPAELPRLETERLLGALARMRVPCSAVVVDAMTVGTCHRCRQARAREFVELGALARFALFAHRGRSSATRARAILVAPAVYPPPHGAEALAQWAGQWQQNGPSKVAPSSAK